MRTRRSPRNQERLWRALFEPKPPIAPVETPCCFNCISYEGVRARGACTTQGAIVNGRTVRAACFRARRTT